MTIALIGKRKRNQVSYLADDYFDDLDLDADIVADASENEQSTDEGPVFDTRKGRIPTRKAKQARTSKPKKETPFQFMDLPAELRDEIYDLALTDPAGLTLVSKTKARRRLVKRGIITLEDSIYYYGKWQRCGGPFYGGGIRHRVASDIGEPSRTLVPNLVAVSKQIREEAESVLYKQELIFEDMTALHTFLAQIGHRNRQMLSKVTVKGWGQGRGAKKGHNYAAFSMLSDCPNIQSLFLDCSSVSYYLDPKSIARDIFRASHHFLESIGFARGRYDAAIDVLEVSGRNFARRSYSNDIADVLEEEHTAQRIAQFQHCLRELLKR